MKTLRFAPLLLVFAACTPEVATGVYACGPDELCPDGLACSRDAVNKDGEHLVTGLCVAPGAVKQFACGQQHADVANDDSPATARTLGDLDCVSTLREAKSCLPQNDTGDFYTLTVPANCPTGNLRAAVTYPVSWQRLVLQVAKVGETPATVDVKCPGIQDDDNPLAKSCLDAPVSPGNYVIGVIADGTGNCDGDCKFNRYTLGVQITTP